MDNITYEQAFLMVLIPSIILGGIYIVSLINGIKLMISGVWVFNHKYHNLNSFNRTSYHIAEITIITICVVIIFGSAYLINFR